MRVFESLDELRAAVGGYLGWSDWHTVTQAQISAFADATGDHQWIHLDADRAAQGPFGTTIAHGFLTLSLLPMLTHRVYEVRGISMAVNYGCNRVRFPAPLPSGSRVRTHVTLQSATEVHGGLQVVTLVEVEVEHGSRPCCVVEAVTRFLA